MNLLGWFVGGFCRGITAPSTNDADVNNTESSRYIRDVIAENSERKIHFDLIDQSSTICWLDREIIWN